MLRSYEALLPAADELSVARRAADVVVLGVYNDAGEGRGARVVGSRGRPAVAGVVPEGAHALQCRRTGQEVMAVAAVAYTPPIHTTAPKRPHHACACATASGEQVVAAARASGVAGCVDEQRARRGGRATPRLRGRRRRAASGASPPRVEDKLRAGRLRRAGAELQARCTRAKPLAVAR